MSKASHGPKSMKWAFDVYLWTNFEFTTPHIQSSRWKTVLQLQNRTVHVGVPLKEHNTSKQVSFQKNNFGRSNAWIISFLSKCHYYLVYRFWDLVLSLKEKLKKLKASICMKCSRCGGESAKGKGHGLGSGICLTFYCHSWPPNYQVLPLILATPLLQHINE